MAASRMSRIFSNATDVVKKIDNLFDYQRCI